jgi:hypothetical protein
MWSLITKGIVSPAWLHEFPNLFRHNHGRFMGVVDPQISWKIQFAFV